MAKIVESESDKELLALLIQVKENLNKWKSLAGEGLEFAKAIAEHPDTLPKSAASARKFIAKAREAGL